MAARAELMNHVAPLGPVYQAGTLAGNPLAMSAGIATLKELAAPGFYEAIEKRAGGLSMDFATPRRRRALPPR